MLQAQIIGNLGADAHYVTGNFEKFVSMNVAHTRKYKKLDGTSYEETVWVNVVVNWDCSKLLPYLLKGTKIYAIGNVKLRTFTTKDGKQAAGMDIIADRLELCSSKQPDTNIPTASAGVDVTTGEILNNRPQNDAPF